MSRPALLIVTGKPATGKTTLALRLSRDLSAPLIHKDAIKEALFDGLGVGDRAWSRKLGVASYRVMYALAEVFLSCGQSLILESNFSAHYDASQLAHMAERFGAVLAQIYLTSDPEVLVERFERRAGGSERHPGHIELQNRDEFREALLTTPTVQLPIPGDTLAIDTTRLELVDYDAALRFARIVFGDSLRLNRSS